MPLFRYQALNANQQNVAGEIEADNVAQAVAQLETQGLTVRSIGYSAPQSHSPQPSVLTPAPTGSRNEIAALESHLLRAMERARPLIPALRAYMAEMPTGRSRRRLLATIDVIEHGDVSLAVKSFTDSPAYWIPLLSSTSSARDANGTLQKFISESRRTGRLSNQWRQIFIYPLLIILVAGAVIAFLSIVVIPVFRDVFSGFGLRVPGFTRFILDVSAVISSGRILWIAAVLIVIALGVLFGARLAPASLWPAFIDRFGPLRRAAVAARFSRFLADLLEADVDAPNALRIASRTTGSSLLNRAAYQLAGEIETGQEVAAAKYRRTITASVVWAVQSHLPLPARSAFLRELSTNHARRASEFLSWAHGIVQPMFILVIGLLVGAVVLALFLPLISLIQGLS
jgi:type IV pilus assembly protein PilC